MEKIKSQLTYEDRISISTLLRAEVRPSQIAKQLKVHRSTISREIKRNGGSLGYLPMMAESKLKLRRQRRVKLKEDKALRDKVFSKLQSGWSPEGVRTANPCLQ